MACPCDCQLKRRTCLQTFYQLNETSILVILAGKLSDAVYKHRVIDRGIAFGFRDVCGIYFYCSSIGDQLKVCCKVRALNRAWLSKVFYIRHSLVLVELETEWFRYGYGSHGSI